MSKPIIADNKPVKVNLNKGDEYYYQYEDPKWKTEFLPKYNQLSDKEKFIKTKRAT